MPSWNRKNASGKIRACCRSVVESLERRQLLSTTGLWHFDEAASATTAADASGNQHTLALVGDATFTPGRSGNALTLDGTGDYATTPTLVDPTDSFTLSAWVKSDPAKINSGPLFSQSGVVTNQFILRHQLRGNRLVFSLSAADVSGGTSTSVLGEEMNYAAWTHVAAVYDNAANEIRLYVNGELEGAAAYNAGGWTSDGPLLVGAAYNSGRTAIAESFKGLLDDVRTDDTALTETQIAQLANAPASSLVNAGPVNEGSASAVSFTAPTGGTGPYSYSYDFDADGTFEIAGSASASAAVPAAYLIDGPDHQTVRGRVTGAGGAFADFATAIQVNNVAPTIAVAATRTFNLDDPGRLTIAVTDPGIEDTHSAVIAWGDGTTSTFAGTRDGPDVTIHASHAYAALGTFTASITVTDDDGGVATASVSINVTATPPAAATDLHAVGVGYTDGLTFAWTDNAADEDGYLIQWYGDGEWFTIDEKPAGTTSYFDEYPVIGSNNYRVVAYRGDDAQYQSYSLPVNVVARAVPVAWPDDNGGTNERETLAYFHTPHDTPLLLNPLGGDVDYDGQTISIASFTQPDFGTLTPGSNGRLLYTPLSHWSGTATFTYKATDGLDDSPPATVKIDVTNAQPKTPRAEYDYTQTAVNATLNGITYPFGLKGQLFAPDSDGDEVTFSITTQPEHGNLILDEETGDFVFVPTSSFWQYDKFVFEADDGITGAVGGAKKAQSIGRNTIRNRLEPKDLSGYLLFGDQETSMDMVVFGDWKILSAPAGVIVSFVPPPVDGVQGTAVPASASDWNAGGGMIRFDRALSHTSPVNVVIQQRHAGLLDKPMTIQVRVSDTEQGWHRVPLGPASPMKFSVSHTLTTTVAGTQTNFLGRPDWSHLTFPFYENSFLTPGQSPTHGTVQLDADGGFTYTPNQTPADEDPYVGFDFFSFHFVDESGNPPVEKWVTLLVGGLENVEPEVPAESEWTNTTFDGSLRGLWVKYVTAKNQAQVVLTKMNKLGEALETLGLTKEQLPDVDADALDDQTIVRLDAAIAAYDAAQAAYDEYLAKYEAVMSAAGAYMKAQTFVTKADIAVEEAALALPRDIAGLRPNKNQVAAYSAALDSFAEGAAMQMDQASFVVNVAVGAHAVLETASLLGGGGMIVHGLYAAGKISLKAGITACARDTALRVARVGGQIVGATVGSQSAVYLAGKLGFSQTQISYIRIGADALQLVCFYKAARLRMKGDTCFVAGTQVAVGTSGVGGVLTRNIEDVRPGDVVLSRDDQDGGDDVTPHVVTKTFVRTAYHERLLTIRDADGNVETLRTTDEHPFYVPGLGWTAAGDLAVGQTLSEADGTDDAVLISTERLEHPEGLTVYNFEVEGDHTYFVADGQGEETFLWVHNADDYDVLGQHPRRDVPGQLLGNGSGDRLRRNLKRAGVDMPASTSPHHIVAHTAPGAVPAKNVLGRVGINIDAADNGVFLPRNGKREVPGVVNHLNIHTDDYYDEVNSRLLAAESGGKPAVLTALEKIRQEILRDVFPY